MDGNTRGLVTGLQESAYWLAEAARWRRAVRAWGHPAGAIAPGVAQVYRDHHVKLARRAVRTARYWRGELRRCLPA